MLTIDNIHKTYGPRTVLNGVSFNLARGQKMALVGLNGTGKTTLLKVIAELESPDNGNVTVQSGTLVGYLPQDTSLTTSESIIDYLKHATGIKAIETEMASLEQDLTDPHSLQRYGDLQERYTRLEGYSFVPRMQAMLSGFGLEGVAADRELSALSSGQKSKVVLVSILMRGVDLLLLDEPTNNLDMPALVWLETFLAQSNAAALIVSHDRAFLDKTTGKVVELDWKNHGAVVRNGNYSDYLAQKEKDKESQQQAFEQQQEEIERLKAEARTKKQEALSGARFVGTDNDKFARGAKRDRAASSGKAAKALEKRIDQMEKVERPIERAAFRIDLVAEGVGGKPELALDQVVAGYDGFHVGPVTLRVPFGKRIAILGLNGSGKTTLLKVLSGSLTTLSGVVRRSPSVTVGNLMQEHDSLPRDKSLYDFLLDRTGLDSPDIYNTLVKFGFNRDHVRDPIAVISPGARARLLLALFSRLSVNTLILDEPTNHLDLEALEALEEVLADYKGTVIAVTHDRYFLEHVHFGELYLLEGGALKELSSLDDYVQTAQQRAKKLIKTLA
ncbi:MAG: ABC-F family ATP-binding cassette domain-containing protein [bacterium]|nr:ABC-F family ATP-binding cassette domain-containing protein [bacterium]